MLLVPLVPLVTLVLLEQMASLDLMELVVEQEIRDHLDHQGLRVDQDPQVYLAHQVVQDLLA